MDKSGKELGTTCPFQNPEFTLHADEPCPVCGDLGTMEALQTKSMKCPDLADNSSSIATTVEQGRRTMTTTGRDECSTCKHWDGEEVGRVGECLRYPPVLGRDDQGKNTWLRPPVWAHEICGEHST